MMITFSRPDPLFQLSVFYFHRHRVLICCGSWWPTQTNERGSQRKLSEWPVNNSSMLYANTLWVEIAHFLVPYGHSDVGHPLGNRKRMANPNTIFLIYLVFIYGLRNVDGILKMWPNQSLAVNVLVVIYFTAFASGAMAIGARTYHSDARLLFLFLQYIFNGSGYSKWLFDKEYCISFPHPRAFYIYNARIYYVTVERSYWRCLSYARWTRTLTASYNDVKHSQ